MINLMGGADIIGHAYGGKKQSWTHLSGSHLGGDFAPCGHATIPGDILVVTTVVGAIGL